MMEAELRAELVEACRRLWQRGLVGGGEGNVSARLPDGDLLVTPSGTNKGFLEPRQLLRVGPGGAVREDRHGVKGRPSSELAMHLAVYAARPETRAVVHAHPLAAVAHTLSGRPLVAAQPEAAVVLGERVPVAPYAVPGTGALAASLREALSGGATVILLERHGAVALGDTVLEAADRMEILERVAITSLFAELLGGATPLGPEAIAAVRAAARAAGLA